MRILIFGASGMIGQGVLRECLAADDVMEVVCIVRKPLAHDHPKLAQIVQDDVADLEALSSKLATFDACFFPLGVSGAGMSDEAYTKVTEELTLQVARQLQRANPGIVFVYVSGAGTNANGRAMWARVKGRTENALLGLLPNAYMFRPTLIHPLDGIRSKTKSYNVLYTILRPYAWAARRLRPTSLTTTRTIGQAMLGVARNRPRDRVLGAKDIRQVAVGAASKGRK